MIRKTRCRRAFVTAVGVIAFALPLAPAAEAGKKKPFKPCALLKKSEVKKAIGEPVKSAKGGKSATGARYCNWTGNDSHVLARGITVIAARDHAKLRYAKYKKLMSSPKPVKGIGDVAATDGQVLIARIGNNRFVYVSPLFKHTGITVDALKPLAKHALKRLK